MQFALILAAIAAQAFGTARLSSCPLFWDSRQNLGYDQGVQLQVCCNVTRTRIWGFSSPESFALSSSPVFEQSVPVSTQDIWSELQLSICSDRSKPSIGWVEGKPPGVTCQYRVGQTLNVPPNLLPLPNWYVLCYEQQGDCMACRLDAVCDNDLSEECAEIYLLGSSPSATNNSIRYWIAVGSKFPFEKNSHVELTVRVQRTGVLVKTEKLVPFAGKKQTLELTGLSPNEVYNVERCLVVQLPESLLGHASLSFDTVQLG
ncbi:unnamed protein product [Caenorhabditis auriculariae]|uniref:Uncharacterized protein n=1 Tax=Caenorhabditis auriculariae TaxID=2777116 RepID=A0A8S1HLQ0_9PELO|nr:unnamed protein product [Caenorhabditis auriculariae]